MTKKLTLNKIVYFLAKNIFNLNKTNSITYALRIKIFEKRLKKA